MGTYGSWTDATIAVGSTDTGEVNLENQYDFLELLIPLMNECKLSLKVAEKTTAQGGTYYELGQGVTTEAEVFGRADVWRLGGFQHIKIVSSNAQATARTLRIRGWRT